MTWKYQLKLYANEYPVRSTKLTLRSRGLRVDLSNTKAPIIA